MTQNVLVQKLSNRRVGRSPIPQLDEISGNFSTKIEELLRKLIRTTVGAIVLSCEVKKLSRVLEDIPVPAMLGVIEVDAVDSFALLNISSDLVYHIVDLRMGGDPAVAPPPTARTFTPIDCAICEGFVVEIVKSFGYATELVLGAPLQHTMRLSHIEQNVTQVRLAPRNSDVLVISLSLDIGEAARMGDCDLIVPLSVLDTLRAEAANAPEPENEDDSRDFWKKHMTVALSAAQTQINAILYRTQMRVEEVESFAVGDVLGIPEKAINEVVLHIGKEPNTSSLALGTLGQLDNKKVVKLTEPPSLAVMEHIAKAIDRGSAG